MKKILYRVDKNIVEFLYRDGHIKARYCDVGKPGRNLYGFSDLTDILGNRKQEFSIFSKNITSIKVEAKDNVYAWPTNKKDFEKWLHILAEFLNVEFEVINTSNNTQTEKIEVKNENRFQRKKGTVLRGNQPKGHCVYGKSSKSAISSRQVSYRAVIGN